MEGLATTFVPFDEIATVFDNIINPKPEVKKQVILFPGAEDWSGGSKQRAVRYFDGTASEDKKDLN